MSTPKKDSPKHGGGREQFHLTPAKLRLAEDKSQLGLYEKDIAILLGVHPNYFPEIKRRHPELAEAIKRGRAKQVEQATKTLSYHVKKKSLNAAIFVLKTRGGYREDGREPNEDDGGGNKESTVDRILANIRKHREREQRGRENSPDRES